MRVSINDEILKDIANSIRSKTDSTDLMYPQAMADNIDTIVTPNNQSKTVTITSNGTETVTPDSDYTGLSSIEITANVPPDFTNYLSSTISPYQVGSSYYAGILPAIKQLPALTLTGNSAMHLFDGLINLNVSPTIDLSSSNIMQYTFYNCRSLTEVNNITFPDENTLGNFEYTFYGCSGLTDLSDIKCYSNDFYRMCAECTSLTAHPQIICRSGSNNTMYGAYTNCSSLESFILPTNASYINNMSMCFYGCTNLRNFPSFTPLNMSPNGLVDAFTNCPNLSNDSLNNIMALCIASPNVTGTNKTLKKVGLSQEQVTTCATLSNYQALINAGWTTGY